MSIIAEPLKMYVGFVKHLKGESMAKKAEQALGKATGAGRMLSESEVREAGLALTERMEALQSVRAKDRFLPNLKLYVDARNTLHRVPEGMDKASFSVRMRAEDALRRMSDTLSTKEAMKLAKLVSARGDKEGAQAVLSSKLIHTDVRAEMYGIDPIPTMRTIKKAANAMHLNIEVWTRKTLRNSPDFLATPAPQRRAHQAQGATLVGKTLGFFKQLLGLN